jgi:DNA mismatch endonuclease (patch repair protein)
VAVPIEYIIQKLLRILMDNLTKTKRSFCMSRIRSKNTKPEMIVKRLLKGLKVKARYHVSSLPGKPDIVIPKSKLVIFINGCFWHQHKNCKRKVMPKTNVKYWKHKLKRNVLLQKMHILANKRIGWKVKVLWECQIKNTTKLTRIIRELIK